MDYYKDRILQITSDLFNWITEAPFLSGKKEALTTRINEIILDYYKPPQVEIAIVGSTGAGKSTLLNALLGERILAVSDMKPCTAVTTTVRFSDVKSYKAEIVFFSIDEWSMEIGTIRKIVTEKGEEDGESQLEVENIKKADQDKIKAAYNIEEITADIDFDSLTLPEDILQYMLPDRKPLVFEDNDVKEFQKKLKQYLSGEDRFWPLVKSVLIEGPFEQLRNGAILVDLPGVNDPNEARMDVTRKHLQNASFIWVVFNMKRALTKDIRDLLMEQKLLRQLLVNGKVNALTLIGTHADEYSEDGLEELGLNEDAESIDIIRERNRRVIKQLRIDLQDLAKELSIGSIRIEDSYTKLKLSLKGTKIFTISSPAYMKLQGIGKLRKDFGLNDIQDTGIPGLLEYLNCVVREYGPEAYYRQVGQKLILLLEDVNQLLSSLQRVTSDEREKINSHIEELRRLLQRPEDDLETELGQYHERHIESYAIRQKDFESRLKDAVLRGKTGLNSKLELWRAIHWATLKAIVVRHGKYTSPSTHTRYDLSGDIADSILETMPFVWDDFFGNFCENQLSQIKGELDGSIRVFFNTLQMEAKATRLFDDTVIASIQDSIIISKKHIEFHIDQIVSGLKSTIQRVRTELALSVNETIQKMMLPAFELASEESGRGMKQRILEVLHSQAKKSEGSMFSTIEFDLRSGISELGLQFKDRLFKLNKKVLELADQTLVNMKIESVDSSQQTTIEESLRQLRISSEKIKNMIEILN